MADRQLDDLQRSLLKLAAQFDGPARKRILAPLQKPIEQDITTAVRRDFGDTSMSGWRRSAPIQMVGKVRVNANSLVAGPAPRAAGPLRVANDGRSGGRRKGRRPNGRTRGKRTWDEAAGLIAKTTPRELEKAIVKEVRGVFK